MTPWEKKLANLSPEARCRITAKVRRAIREERWWQGQADEMESVAHTSGYRKGLVQGGRFEFWSGIVVGIMVGGGLAFGWQVLGLFLFGGHP
jgi:hypothetical protein